MPSTDQLNIILKPKAGEFSNGEIAPQARGYGWLDSLRMKRASRGKGAGHRLKRPSFSGMIWAEI